MNIGIFVCPLCKGALQSSDLGYHCAPCARDYPIIDGIPDFYVLEDPSEEPEDWRKNLVWLDLEMVAAREIIYRLSVRELKGMTYAMQQLGSRTFPGCRILEVGSGTGHFTRWMGEVCAPGTEIYGLDFSWPMFARARANTTGQPGVTLLRANSTGRLPFEEALFDLVFVRLAPLSPGGLSSTQAAFRLLKPGGWLFKAGWEARHEDIPWTEYAFQNGYAYAEAHDWLYSRAKTEEEYAASRVECERAIAFGAPYHSMPEEPGSLVAVVREHLRIAQKPAR